MNIFNVVLILISQFYCAKNKNVYVIHGFLCQGEIENPPSKIENVTGHWISCSRYHFEDEEKYPSLFEVTQNDERLLYNYIAFCDKITFLCDKLDYFLIYNEFEFRIDGVCTKMPDVSYEEKSQEEKAKSRRFYESRVYNIEKILSYLIYDFLYEYEYNFKILDYDYRALVPQTDDKNSNENGKFSARKFILEQLDFIKKHDRSTDEKKKKLHGELKKIYSSKKLEKLISGEKDKSPEDYSEEEMRLYTQRCFDIITEYDIYQKEKDIIRYMLPEKGKTSMSYRNVIVFKFDFQAILNNYEDKNPKKEEIKPEDFVFYDEQTNVVKISHDDIFVLSYEDPIYSYVAVDLEALRSLKVVKFTCGELVKKRKHFQSKLYMN